MKTQFSVSVRFLFHKYISSVIGFKLPLFAFQIEYVRQFLIFTVTIFKPLNMVTII